MSSLRYTFDKPEALEEHLDDFEFFCDSKGAITADQKRGMLMETLDQPTKRSLRDWLAPTLTLRTATYGQIVAKLREKIQPSVNKFVAWANFTRRKQQDGETGAAFHADLRRLATPCGFEGSEAKLILYQFVTGLRSLEQQQALLSRHTDLTLTEALRTVLSSEESVVSSKVVRGPPIEELHRAETSTSRNPRYSRDSRNSHNSRNSQTSSTPMICYRCGDDTHNARNCPKPWKNFRCTKCGKGQHLAKACRQQRHTLGKPPPSNSQRSNGQNFVAND